MAWIESHQELARHPKTKRFARLLGVSLPAAVGHLHFLWWWAMDYADDGSLSRFDAHDIADACGWDGDSKLIADSLREAGFIDITKDGPVIHDWHEYAGRLVEKREQNRERKQKSRARHAPVTRPSQENEGDGHGGHGATEPDLTVPKRTTTTTAHEESDIDPSEPQSMTEAHQKVFGTNIIPSLHSNFLIPILQNLGERYAIELLLETGEAAGKPSLRYMQEVHAGWQKKGSRSRAEAKANKPSVHNRGDPPKNKLETLNEKTMREIQEAEERERARGKEALYAHSERL
jgi:hypothetical protein